MKNTSYTVTVESPEGFLAFDFLFKKSFSDEKLNELSIRSLTELYNGAVELLNGIVGAENSASPVGPARDKKSAVVRVQKIQSSIVARVESAKAVEAEEMSPGFARLKNSGKLEEIRQDVLAGQKRGLEMVRAEREAAERKVTMKERVARETTTLYKDDVKIVVKNAEFEPRGPVAERWNQVRGGDLTVGEYISRVGRKLATHDFRHWRKAGAIDLVPAA